MKHYLKNKTIVITGGSSGFGLETAKMLLQMDANVIITGRDQSRLDKAEKQLNSSRLLAIKADATLIQDWKHLIKEIAKKHTIVDVLVNNHGAGHKNALLDDLTDNDIQQIVDTNLISVIKGCREFCKVMQPNGKGHIINVSSICAKKSWATWSVYTAAKSGLVSFTRSLHMEMMQWGGKATTFIPAAAKTNFATAANIDTDWLEGFPTGEEFARSLVHCIDIPDNCIIEELTIWGTKQIKDMINAY